MIMKNKMLILFICLFITVGNSFAQDFKMPVLSPLAKVEQQFSTSTIKIEYSRPSKRGRTVFGDVVPYDKHWRTGANSNTKLTFGENVTFGGKIVPAGTYSLYTIPGVENWVVVLNKSTENWGNAGYNADNDLLRIDVRPIQKKEITETFTIELSKMTPNSCVMELSWDQVLIPIKIEADNKERIFSYLEKELNGEKLLTNKQLIII
ncbi:MAG: asparagine synthetase B [Bacteroidetes bacterium OLB11]|nr:MAG: asparagine synthetase B [Bacteroidetes bacterium OLB11]